MIHDDLNLVSRWLARRDVETLDLTTIRRPVDAIVLIGNSLVGSVRVAADAFHNGVSERLLVSGGVGHSTEDLRDHVRSHPTWRRVETVGRAEAEIMRDLLILEFGMSAQAITIEAGSRNCGENATESRRLLDRLGSVQSLVIIQDPTMQRRTHATFERAWSDARSTRIISFAPFVPEVGSDMNWTVESDPVWSFARFLSLIIGEIDRLRDDADGYGPVGMNFIDHVEIPEAVLGAYDRIRTTYDGVGRRANSSWSTRYRRSRS